MITLEQVRLLESKVVKTLDYVKTVSAENNQLREKLETYRSRIDELETIVLAFKEDQGRIEAGIISALDRLNQFEDAIEQGLAETVAGDKTNHKASSIATDDIVSEAVVSGESDLEPEIFDETSEPEQSHFPEENDPVVKPAELDIF